MSIGVKNNTSYAVEIEVTEGTYVPPSAGTSFVQTLQSGADLLPAKQLLQRDIFTGSIGEVSPRVGESQATATLPCEARASSTEGAAPEIDKLMQGAFGARHQITTTTTTKTGNTDTVLQIEDADISKFHVGDIVMLKISGAYHVSPVTAVDSTSGSANITLLIANPSGAVPDSTVISKSTTYTVAESGHPALSISKYIETAVREYAVGCKVKSMAFDNFATGQIPSFKFGLEGLNYDRSLSARPYTPSYDSSVPPIVLDGRMYISGTETDINKLTVTMDNALGFESSVNAPNGRISSRVTKRTIKGTLDPYKKTDDNSNYTNFAANTPFSLFAYAKVPTGTDGEFNQVVAIYMPNCLITDLAEADDNGLLQDSISFSANRGTSGTIPEIYIAFI